MLVLVDGVLFFFFVLSEVVLLLLILDPSCGGSCIMGYDSVVFSLELLLTSHQEWIGPV